MLPADAADLHSRFHLRALAVQEAQEQQGCKTHVLVSNSSYP
jgi:hypothetical protein